MGALQGCRFAASWNGEPLRSVGVGPYVAHLELVVSGRNAIRRKFWTGGLAVLISAGSCAVSAVAEDKMPPAAPPIQRSDTQEPVPANNEKDVFVRKASAEGAGKREPLSAAVTRFGAAGETQNSGQYMIGTPPITGGTQGAVIPPGAFRLWLQQAHPKFALTASGNAPGDVLEVKGRWDYAGKTLAKLGIPFDHIGSNKLDDYPLDKVKVLIINCSGTAPRESYQRVRDFVARGGYLLTTDWALDNFLQKAFPGYVAYDKKRNRRSVYDAEVVDPDPVLFQRTVSNSYWRLDEDCHLLTVLKPDTVRVLVRSHGLATDDGQGILAVTFPFGRGQVLHLVGHFDNNPVWALSPVLPDPAPVIGISLRQAIAANFVVAGITKTAIPTHGLR